MMGMDLFSIGQNVSKSKQNKKGKTISLSTPKKTQNYDTEIIKNLESMLHKNIKVFFGKNNEGFTLIFKTPNSFTKLDFDNMVDFLDFWDKLDKLFKKIV